MMEVSSVNIVVCGSSNVSYGEVHCVAFRIRLGAIGDIVPPIQ